MPQRLRGLFAVAARVPHRSPSVRGVRGVRGRAPAVALVAGVVTAAGAVAQVVVTQAASAGTVLCDQFASTRIQHGRYVVQNNRWGSSATQCVNVTGAGFSVTRQDGVKPTNGAPNSYPSVYYGCHYGNCSSGTILPLRVGTRAFAAIRTSVSLRFPSAGTWDAAYDIWFDPTPRTNGQNTGAEVMVWLNHQGGIQPVGSPVGAVTLAGGTWTVWEGNVGWNVVSYVRGSPTAAASFPVSAFFTDAVRRGFAQTSWYLTSIQAGFEPWQGGAGLTVNSFTVTTTGTAAAAAPAAGAATVAPPSHHGPNCPAR